MIDDIIEFIALFIVSMAFSGGIYFHKKAFKTARDKHWRWWLFTTSAIIWTADCIFSYCRHDSASALYMVTDIIAISACYLGGTKAEQQIEILCGHKSDEEKRIATHKLLSCIAIIPVFGFILRTIFIHGW